MRTQLGLGLCVVALCATTASGALVNRYSFTSDASDSVGGKHGTLVGVGATISGGQVVLSNPDPSVSATAFNNGAIPTQAGFVDFPNFLISQAAAAGQYGAVSVEFWVTMTSNRNWAALFSAGISSAVVDGNAAGGNEHFPYVQVVPRSGDGGAGNDLRIITNGVAGPEGIVDEPGDGTDLALGVQEHVIAVFDQSGGLPGVVTAYRNGVQYGTSAAMANNLDIAAVATVFPITGLADINVWLGRSQWPDPMLNASVNEFRVYSHALTLSEAAANFAAGPDVVIPEPTSAAIAALGLAALAAFRRR